MNSEEMYPELKYIKKLTARLKERVIKIDTLSITAAFWSFLFAVSSAVSFDIVVVIPEAVKE